MRIISMIRVGKSLFFMLISLFPEIVGTFRRAMTMMTSATVIIVIDGKVEKEVHTINKGKLPWQIPFVLCF
jgi:hypothetical protein